MRKDETLTYRVTHGINRLVHGITRLINCINRLINGIIRWLINGWAAPAESRDGGGGEGGGPAKTLSH